MMINGGQIRNCGSNKKYLTCKENDVDMLAFNCR